MLSILAKSLIISFQYNIESVYIFYSNPVLYYNLIGPPSYMRSVVDRTVVMRRMTVHAVLVHLLLMYWFRDGRS
jgi:hypothetical protein